MLVMLPLPCLTLQGNILGRDSTVTSSVINYRTRVSSKQTKKIQFELKQNLFRLCFGLFRETNNKKFWFVSISFGLFWCFEPISKQPKQTELFQNKPKQTETTLNFLKNTKICSISNCFRWSSVCFGSIKASKLSVLV